MWGYNGILFMHGWFCPIHLIQRKSLHFEKLDCPLIKYFESMPIKWRRSGFLKPHINLNCQVFATTTLTLKNHSHWPQKRKRNINLMISVASCHLSKMWGFYRPQTKVMFLQVSVCPQWGHAHPLPLANPPVRILRDALNERAVRILLESILVLYFFCCPIAFTIAIALTFA